MNASPTFHSPLRAQTTEHKKPLSLVSHCVNEMRHVTVRGGPGQHGLADLRVERLALARTLATKGLPGDLPARDCG